MSTDFREVGLDEIKELLLYKTIKKWDVDKLVLDDGTIVTIEMTDNDCCASAGGEFTDVKLDAVITDVVLGENISNDEDDEDLDFRVNNNTLTLYHNQNPIAIADAYADNGNGGYYYSVCSLVIGKVFLPIVSCS